MFSSVSLSCVALTGALPQSGSSCVGHRLKDKVRKCRNCWIGGVNQRYVLETKAVLDSSKKGSSGQHSSDPTDPSRRALEKLFLQAQSYDPQFETESPVELAVTELELDLKAAVEALRKKEDALQAAEKALKEDRWELHTVRVALKKREEELEVARSSHLGKKDELTKTQKRLVVLGDELHKAKVLLRKKEGEIKNSESDLELKQEEVSRSHALLLQKDEALLHASSNLKSIELRFHLANELVSKQLSENQKLQASLQEKEGVLTKLLNEKQLRQKQLQRAEAELEQRAISWISSQDELKSLRRDLINLSSTQVDLVQAQNLLIEVQKELGVSHSSVAKLRATVDEQTLLLAIREEEILEQKSLQISHKDSLESAIHELEKERDQLKLAETSYKVLNEQLFEARTLTETLQEQLLEQKLAIQNSRGIANTLKRDLEVRDSSLSDACLALQLKETELLGTKLEVQQLKSELASTKLTLRERGLELQAAQTIVQDLRKEIAHLKAILVTKEDNITNMTTLLLQKDEQLLIMRMDLNDSKAKLSEATSAVQQITVLSRALVESAKQGDICTFNSDAVLTETNYKLFSARRILFEKELQLQQSQEKFVDDVLCRQTLEAELEAVKECLREKDYELSNAQESLCKQEQNMKQLLSSWELRETEVAEFRQEVIEQAKGLASLHAVLQNRDGDREGRQGEHAGATLEVEATLAALQSLSGLSKELLERSAADCQVPLVVSSMDPTLGNKDSWGQGLELGDLKMQLIERDSALETTRNAIANLTKLTEKLVSDATLGQNSQIMRYEGDIC